MWRLMNMLLPLNSILHFFPFSLCLSISPIQRRKKKANWIDWHMKLLNGCVINILCLYGYDADKCIMSLLFELIQSKREICLNIYSYRWHFKINKQFLKKSMFLLQSAIFFGFLSSTNKTYWIASRFHQVKILIWTTAINNLPLPFSIQISILKWKKSTDLSILFQRLKLWSNDLCNYHVIES